MLSYRKSQQVLLAEKLKKKNVIHVLGVFGSGTTMAHLCHSAFARVATAAGARNRVIEVLCHSAFARVATLQILCHLLRHQSLPQRIRAGCDSRRTRHLSQSLTFATAHSRGLRRGITPLLSINLVFATAHSRGLRRRVCSCLCR